MRSRLHTLLFLFVLLPLLAAAATKPELPPPGPERPLNLPSITEKKLSNGMLIVVAPLKNIPKVSAIITFKAGNSLWRNRASGSPSIAANVAKEGTTSRSSQQINEELRSMGATLNSSVSADATQFSGSTLSEFSEKYLAVIADIVRNPTYPETEVELAKQNQIQNIRGQRASPDFLAQEAIKKAVFGDHPYSFLVPDEASIQKITPALLKEFAAQYYVPNNAHLILVGDIQPDAAFAAAELIFGNWQRKDLPVEEAAAIPLRDKREITFVHRPGSIQSSIILGIATFPRKDPDYFPARTADTIFGASFNSRLTQNIREKRGYTYSPSSTNSTLAKLGSFTVNASVRNEVTGATLVEIFYEMDRMRVLPVTDEELAAARAYQNGTFSVELASQSSLAGRIDTIYTYELDRAFVKNFRDNVTAVTTEAIQRAAAKYFDTYRCAIVIVGDYEKVKDQVLPFGTVKVIDENGKSLAM